MLTDSDTPTIRHAIVKRLDPKTEPGVRLADIRFQKYGKGDGYYADPPACKVQAIAAEPFMRVSLLLQIGESIVLDARFDLPNPCEHGHLLAEIGEIANACRAARRDFFTAALPMSERKFLPGTGTRGNWSRYGLRRALNEDNR